MITATATIAAAIVHAIGIIAPMCIKFFFSAVFSAPFVVSFPASFFAALPPAVFVLSPVSDGCSSTVFVSVSAASPGLTLSGVCRSDVAW